MNGMTECQWHDVIYLFPNDAEKHGILDTRMRA